VISHAEETNGVPEAEPECPDSVKSELMGKYRDTYCDKSPAPEDSSDE
jgi:hypothetical protein